MNAMTQAGLPGIALAPSPLLTRMDLSSEEVVKDCIYELERCQDDLQFARWARKWGEALRAWTREAEESSASDSEYELEIEELREAKIAIENAADDLINAVRDALKTASGPKTEAILRSVTAFEGVLREHEETEA